MNAATVFGGTALRKDLPRILRIALVVMLVLVMFSHPFLGVHTPQDILVGAAAGLLVMWLVLRLFRWVDAHPQKDWLVVLIGMVLAVAVVAYAALKTYPTDYGTDG